MHPNREEGVARVGLIISILVLALVGAAGWYGWRWLDGATGELATLRQSLMEQITVREQAEADAAQSRRALEARLETLAERVEERDKALSELLEGGQRRWLLNEAEALARLAEERLLLTADLEAAEHLLEVADRTLARLHDPETLPARKALAADREAIRGARQVDVQSLMLRLGALQELAMEVAVPVGEADVPVPPAREAPAGASWWQELLAELPVVVRHHEERLPVPLGPRQASLVRLSLDTSLQQAQFALQQGRPQVYRQAIEHALLVTRSWLNTRDPKVQQLIDALGELGQAPVAQALPDIGKGREAIQALRREPAP